MQIVAKAPHAWLASHIGQSALHTFVHTIAQPSLKDGVLNACSPYFPVNHVNFQ